MQATTTRAFTDDGTPPDRCPACGAAPDLRFWVYMQGQHISAEYQCGARYLAQREEWRHCEAGWTWAVSHRDDWDRMARQIERLADFILTIPGEPSQDQGAVDTAIRLLASARDEREIAAEKAADHREEWLERRHALEPEGTDDES